MIRSQLNPMPEYFDRYIQKCDDVNVLEAIKISIAELDDFPVKKWERIGELVYAPGKWTVKDILQHLIDTERIFTYRALAFARGEKKRILPYDESEYAASAKGNTRSLTSLIVELRTTHQAFLAMYQSFTKEMLLKRGMGFKGSYSVADIGFIIPGHQRWHLEILKKKYYPLIFE